MHDYFRTEWQFGRWRVYTNLILVDMTESIIVFSLCGVGALFAFFSLITARENRPSTGLVNVLFAIVFQGAGFGRATYVVYKMMVDVNRGIYNGAVIVPDYSARFGWGLYLSGFAIICYITSAAMMGRQHTNQKSFQYQRWGP